MPLFIILLCLIISNLLFYVNISINVSNIRITSKISTFKHVQYHYKVIKCNTHKTNTLHSKTLTLTIYQTLITHPPFHRSHTLSIIPKPPFINLLSVELVYLQSVYQCFFTNLNCTMHHLYYKNVNG